MIRLLYRGPDGRAERSFRDIKAARRYCRQMLRRPVHVVEAFGYATDPDGATIVPLTGCTVEDLYATAKADPSIG
jgi:hypothetical protein